LSPKYAISIVRRFCALSISDSRCLARATRWPLRGGAALERVKQIVEPARRVERRASLVTFGEPRRRAAARDLDHEVDVVVAEVVADSHAAQDHRLVVEHVQLGVVEALLVAVDRHHLVIEQRVRERARFLAQRAPPPVDGHQRPGLEARNQADPFVEEALLGPFQVLVGHADAVLEDLHLDPAIGGGEQRPRDHLAGLVVAPFEAAHQDASLGLLDPLQDARERGLAARQQIEARARLGAFDGQATERHRGGQCNVARRASQPTRLTKGVAYFALTSVVHCR
jgi:hypothetical protein